MNRENIKKVRDFIAALPEERFKMEQWVGYCGDMKPNQFMTACGTAACIGGWTNVLLGDRTRSVRDMQSEGRAARQLGLSAPKAMELFYPMAPQGVDWKRGGIRNCEAVAVLDHLLETGEVDWGIVVRSREAARKIKENTDAE